jgi:hypothetical protein
MMDRNLEWSDVLGNQITAREAYRQYQATALHGHETLAQWIERKSLELWGNEHDPNLDYEGMAAALLKSAGK